MCPLDSCTSKAVKKLSNHLTYVHKIKDPKERESLLARAKEVGEAKKGDVRKTAISCTIKQSFCAKRVYKKLSPLSCAQHHPTRSFLHKYD